MLGKKTVRRCSVYFSASNDFAQSSSHSSTRFAPRPRASTVREPSTVSESVVVICEYDAVSAR